MLIHVNQNHINHGIPDSCARCPIALAIAEVCKPEVMVSVTPDDIELSLEDGIHPPTHATIGVGPKIEDWIERFDNGDPVGCIAFRIDIPIIFLKDPIKI
jgi:hypothetical protein